MAEIIRPFPETFRLKRPMPPATMLDPDQFEALTLVPAPDLETWLRPTFIKQGTPLQQHDRGRAPGSPVFGQAERGEPAVMGNGPERAQNFRSRRCPALSRISS
jgi:hypothetical protein